MQGGGARRVWRRVCVEPCPAHPPVASRNEPEACHSGTARPMERAGVGVIQGRPLRPGRLCAPRFFRASRPCTGSLHSLPPWRLLESARQRWLLWCQEDPCLEQTLHSPLSQGTVSPASRSPPSWRPATSREAELAGGCQVPSPQAVSIATSSRAMRLYEIHRSMVLVC